MPLLSVEQSIEILYDNRVYLTKMEVAQAVDEMLSDINIGRKPAKRGFNICGPEGVGKTELWLMKLRNNARLAQARWETLDEDDRVRYFKHLTEDRRAIDGTMKFIAPWAEFVGENTVPVFLRKLRLMAPEGNVAFFDDYRTFSRPDDAGRKARLIVHQALDDTNDGLVDMLNFDTMAMGNWNFHGCIINNWNIRLNDSWDGNPPALKLMGRALSDRFRHFEISFDPEAITSYLIASAFVDTKDSGLWKFLVQPAGPTYPDDWPDEELRGKRMPYNDRGIGFEGSDDEAIALMSDVMAEFYEVWEKLQHLSFRTLQERLAERVKCGEDVSRWKHLLLQRIRRDAKR